MIIALEEAKYRLENFRANIEELGSALRIDELREKLAALDATTQDPEFWNDQANSGKILKEVKRLKDKIAEYDDLYAKLEDTVTLAELAIEENDESMVEEVLAEQKAIEAEEEKLRIEILLSGEFRYLGLSSGLTALPPNPITFPLVLIIGNMTRLRNLS